LGSEFDGLAADSGFDKSRLLSIQSLDFATTTPDLPRVHFNDLTSGGYGLPVNVAEERIKTDLSILPMSTGGCIRGFATKRAI